MLFRSLLLLLGLRPTDSSDLNLQWNLLSQLHSPSSSWKQIESLEEQPVAYIGGSPRDLAFSLKLPKQPQIPLRLKSFGEQELFRVLKKLKLSEAEFETWITYNSWGNLKNADTINEDYKSKSHGSGLQILTSWETIAKDNCKLSKLSSGNAIAA